MKNLIKDENTLGFDNIENCSNRLGLNDVLKKNILKCPDSYSSLKFDAKTKSLIAKKNEYKLLGVSPVLYPTDILNQWNKGKIKLKYGGNALTQYIILSQLRQYGEVMGSRDSIPNLKNRYRYKKFCKSLKGLVLDIGCDEPSVNSQLFSSSCDYIGLDPYAGPGEFRIIGLGEILPFKDNTFDVVSFNGSMIIF